MKLTRRSLFSKLAIVAAAAPFLVAASAPAHASVFTEKAFVDEAPEDTLAELWKSENTGTISWKKYATITETSCTYSESGRQEIAELAHKMLSNRISVTPIVYWHEHGPSSQGTHFYTLITRAVVGDHEYKETELIQRLTPFTAQGRVYSTLSSLSRLSKSVAADHPNVFINVQPWMPQRKSFTMMKSDNTPLYTVSSTGEYKRH